MMKKHDDGVGFKISLLSVASGHKERVVNELSNAIEKGTSSKPIAILKLFGRYDICAIYKTNNYLSGPSKLGSIDGIRGSNQIFAFSYPSKNKQNLFKTKTNYPIWGLLFFRTNQFLSEKYGYLVEQVLSHNLKNFSLPKGIVLDVLGTTGWAELVFIVRGDKFSSVTSTLNEISQTSVEISADKGKNTEHLFSAKTFSLIGVDFKYLKGSASSNLPTLFNEKYSKDKTHPVLGITCSPGDMKTIYNYAEKALGSCSTTFGGKDFLIDPQKCKTWGVLLETLLKMRKDLARNIYSTSLEIRCPIQNEKFENYPSQPNNNKGINVNPPLLKKFKKWKPYFENRLLNLYFGISNLIQDPLVGDSFKDLRLSIECHLPELLDGLSPEDDKHRRMVWEIMEALSYGAEERANSAFLAIENIENRFSPTKGGVQRLISAAQVLPSYILSRIGLTWNGFMIAGFQNRGFAESGEIINLPFEYLFHPEEWWGVFHEIGHVTLWKKEFIDLLNNEDIKSCLNSIVADPKQKMKRLVWAETFMEIAADSFDLFFCHENLDSYLRNIWPYITQTMNKVEHRHFSRYFCMFQYWQYLIMKKETTFPLRVNLDSDLESFIKYLKNLGVTFKRENEYDNEAKNTYRVVSPVIEIIHTTYQNRKKRFLSKEANRYNNTSDAINAIMKGNVFTTPLSHPDKFILALKEKKRIQRKLSIELRIAAILSLWHTSQINKYKPTN
jgi:hypothetical protein